VNNSRRNKDRKFSISLSATTGNDKIKRSEIGQKEGCWLSNIQQFLKPIDTFERSLKRDKQIL